MIRIILGILLAWICGAAQADSYAEVVSQYRKEHGLSAVRYDASLTSVAQNKAWSMANGGAFDHNSSEFAGRISAVSSHAAENIATGLHFLPVHTLTWYRENLPAAQLPATEAAGETVLSLPLAGAHTGADVDDVLAALHKLHAAFTQ